MASASTKLMALYPHKEGELRASNIDRQFYFHTPAPWSHDTGSAITNESNVMGQGGVSNSNGRSAQKVTWSGQFLFHHDYALYHGTMIDVELPADAPVPVAIPGTDPVRYVWEYPENRTHDAVYPNFVMSPPSGFQFDNGLDSKEFLEDMKANDKVAILVIRDMALGKADDVNMLVQLTSLQFSEKEYEPDIRYYDIGFTEYKKQTIREVPSIGAPIPTGKPKKDKYGRFISHFTVQKQIGQKKLITMAYGQYSTTLWLRFKKANGGDNWLKKLRLHKPTRLAFKTNDTGQQWRNGPWFFEPGAKVYFPPTTGPLKPGGKEV